MSKKESNSDAKLQAYNDMLKERKTDQKSEQRLKADFNKDAIADADIFRFVFGDEFVDSNNTILQNNKERLA